MKSNKVFISYSSKDNLVATALCHYLESRKIRCWIAPRDIFVGKDYAQSIIEAIEDSAIMIVIFSGFSNASQHVKSEVERAFKHELIIMPFRIENVVPSRSLEYFLSSTHWLDAFDDKAEKYFEDLYKNCNIILNQNTEELASATIERPETNSPKPSPPKNKSSFKLLIIVSAIVVFGIIFFVLFHHNSPKNMAAVNAIGNTQDTLKNDSTNRGILLMSELLDSIGSIETKDSNTHKETPVLKNTVNNQKDNSVNSTAPNAYKISSSINGTYWKMENADELSFSRSSAYSLDFTGRIQGEFLTGMLVPISSSSFKIISKNASGDLMFTNDYKNVSGEVKFKSLNILVAVNLTKK